MSIIQGTAKTTAGDASFYSFPISSSLRFDGSSYLSFTPTSTGNVKTWTLSMWIKIDKPQAGMFFGANESSSLRFNLGLYRSDENFHVMKATGYAINVYSNAKFRDISAFYHFVIEVDTRENSYTTGIKTYVNNNLLTYETTSSYSSANIDTLVNKINNTMYIGQDANNSFKFHGYMANIELVDGYKTGATVATHDDFGELKNGVWIPKAYTGNYGTNGFRLSFSDATSTTTLGYDSSGNNNDWTLV